MRLARCVLLVTSFAVLLAPALPATAGSGASIVTVPVVDNAARNPAEVPPPITRTTPRTLHVHLIAKEVVAKLAGGERYLYWTYALPGGKAAVPGPMIRTMAGDTVVLKLTDDAGNVEPHGIDFHAVIGPGGGGLMADIEPGETRTFTFKTLVPGAYIYHCGAEGKPWEHVSHGMYGLIQVDPPGGLPRGYQEFYVGQNEWYVSPALRHDRSVAFHDLDDKKAEASTPDFVTFNGNTKALTSRKLYGGTMNVQQGAKVRIFFVNGGPNLVSSFHVIGEIFDRVYTASRQDALRHEETVAVPPGSAAVFELTAGAPGVYSLVDHALWHAEEGAIGSLTVAPKR